MGLLVSRCFDGRFPLDLPIRYGKGLGDLRSELVLVYCFKLIYIVASYIDICFGCIMRAE